MKWNYSLALLFLFSSMSYGQEYKKLRVGIGLGLASGLQVYSTRSTSSGIAIYLEPSFRLKDNISIGFRLEGVTDLAKEIGSYGLNAQYYFSKKKLRPFAGLGLSLCHSGFSQDPFYGYSSRNEETTLGFYPRVGFDYGHFSLIIDLNIFKKANATIYPPASSGLNQMEYTDQINNNYLSIKAGIFIGGGRKKKL